jgi:hypothetical protein
MLCSSVAVEQTLGRALGELGQPREICGHVEPVVLLGRDPQRGLGQIDPLVGEARDAQELLAREGARHGVSAARVSPEARPPSRGSG